MIYTPIYNIYYISTELLAIYIGKIINVNEWRSLQGAYNGHYEDLSSKFDHVYSITQHYNAVTTFISRQLTFSPEDSVADIGAGTGEIARLLYEQNCFKNPIVCIEPTEAFVKVASQKHGVSALHLTAEEFLLTYEGPKFDKVLMIACYHHFKDEVLIMDGLCRILSENGVCFVFCYTVSENSAPILFTKAKEDFKKTEVDFVASVKIAESKGLKAKYVRDVEKCKFEKELSFSFIRNRGMTSLAELSEVELQNGLDELEKRYKDVDIIDAEFLARMVIITKI